MGLDESPWQKVMAAALVGTERQPFTPPMVRGQLGQLLSHLSAQSPEAALLATAATLSLYQQAGGLPVSRPDLELGPCDHADLPRCSSQATRFLQQILQGEYPVLLSEWLTFAARAGQRAPELFLPDLLDLGKQQRDLRAFLLPVLGQRGRWLAAQNPVWNYAIEVATEEEWETGNQAARLLYLQTLRSHNPDQARELLQGIWSQEPAGDRVKYLESFRVGLSAADEPFLEAGSTDRSKEVRRVAADLLASLPTSRLCQNVANQVMSYVRVTRNPKLTIAVDLPTTLDPAWVQYGIEPKMTKQVASHLGEKGWWLLQLIAATPLKVWSQEGVTPTELVQRAKQHEWEAVLLDGWALAAKRQQDAEWSEALLTGWITGKGSTRSVALVDLNPNTLLKGIPPDRQDAFLSHFLESGRGAIDDSLTIWLLRHSHSHWSTELSRLVLSCVGTHIVRNDIPSNLSWELRTALQEFARFMSISLVPEVLELRSQLAPESPWVQSVEAFLLLLQFRQKMAQAFDMEN